MKDEDFKRALRRMTLEDAKKQGYKVDETCYPWVGFGLGGRFESSDIVLLKTDFEAELCKRIGLPAVRE